MRMDKRPEPSADRWVLSVEGLGRIFSTLQTEGYPLIGPTVRDAALVLGELQTVDDLPAGWVDEQAAGFYRLKPGAGDSLFAYVVGAHSLKNFLYPADMELWQAQYRNGSFEVATAQEPVPAYAFIGVRGCDLAALSIQDLILCRGEAADPDYRRRREAAFIVAVDCIHPGGTCFCTSMGTGPAAVDGFDIALTEIVSGVRHDFIARAGSEAGLRLIQASGAGEARREDLDLAAGLLVEAAGRMGRRLAVDDLDTIFEAHFEDPHWEDVAARCLTCGNCTLVCPTCFCHDVLDGSALDRRSTVRRRLWSSCFTKEFSYIHGGSIRDSEMSRYRQWLTHKLVTWVPQFGMRGCVGCGRCITWCPVGIDITAEAAALMQSRAAK